MLKKSFASVCALEHLCSVVLPGEFNLSIQGLINSGEVSGSQGLNLELCINISYLDTFHSNHDGNFCSWSEQRLGGGNRR